MAAFWIVGGLVWLFAGHDSLALLLGGLVGLVAWWIESNLWPEIPGCWNPFCKGGRLSYSPFVPKAFRKCRRCGGSGRRRRLLAGGS